MAKAKQDTKSAQAKRRTPQSASVPALSKDKPAKKKPAEAAAAKSGAKAKKAAVASMPAPVRPSAAPRPSKTPVAAAAKKSIKPAPKALKRVKESVADKEPAKPMARTARPKRGAKAAAEATVA